MNVCLDSWAVLAWLDGDEPAASRVASNLSDQAHMSWINVCEVYYRVARDHGEHEADEVLTALKERLALELPTTNRMVSAARLKATYSVALADCFAIATAVAHSATLLTGDPEIIDAKHLPCSVEDLRSS